MIRSGAKRKYNWGGALIGLLAPLVCLMFVVPAMLSGNILFATGIIIEKPIEIIVYYMGETVIYTPDTPEYEVLLNAAYDTLASEEGFYQWGWSEERFAQARSEGVSIELLYIDPVKVPGRQVNSGDTLRLFFPLDVFGWNGEAVFRGGDDFYWGAPIRVDTLDRVREAVDELFR